MGLDMYLNRAPRYRGITPEQIKKLNGYFDWIKRKESNDMEYSLYDWCHVREEELPSEDCIAFYRKYYACRYSYWDDEQKYGFDRIDEDVGYWHGANQIHNWFVENIQHGEDNCLPYEVSKTKLYELLDLCYEVLENMDLADDLLPTVNGCFFDSTEHDEWYMKYLRETIKILEQVLKETNFDTHMIVYRASW